MIPIRKLAVVALAALLSSGMTQAALYDRGGGLVYDDILDVTWLADANYARTSGYHQSGWMTLQQAMNWANSLDYYDTVREVTWSDWRLPMVRNVLPFQHFDSRKTYFGSDLGYNVRTVDSDGTIYSELAHMYFNNLGFKSSYAPDAYDQISYSEYWVSGDEFGEGAGWYCCMEGLETVGHQNDHGIFGDGTGYFGERDGLGPNGVIVNLSSWAYWTETKSYLWHNGDAVESYFFFYNYSGEQSRAAPDGPSTYQFYAWAIRSGDVAAIPEPFPATLFSLGLVGIIAAQRYGLHTRKKKIEVIK